jgi:hypothetical protein
MYRVSKVAVDLRLGIVCAASNADTLQRCLLASPALEDAALPLVVVYGAPDAASVLNVAYSSRFAVDWWIWVHQDVVLPAGWLENFRAQLALAIRRWPNVAAVSNYGLTADGVRAGDLLDRGEVLREPLPLPCLARSFDEHLIGLRADAGLRFDPGLGFDLYGTDVALSAERAGFSAAILPLYCEHWSTTPRCPPFPRGLVSRYLKSAVYFEQKWQAMLPLSSPHMSFDFVGSAAVQCAAFPVRD